jgi:hypothetical protein
MRRALSEVENQPLETVGEQAHPPGRPFKCRKLQSAERIGLGQKMRGVGVLGVVWPMDRAPAAFAIIDHHGTITDLTNDTAVRKQDYDEQCTSVVID